ncbi:homogentisate 1,2-dioxygenase [Sphingobacterium sp. lm-10]|uniref:homogentisate 1,2-dioxygenase n=1 Tax=Sphingobacterium sp. lm-10 TaxID=2944904 RepID=UPI0020220A9D|nr:homogentisate 1,2-dioxygenase [Sphingobacterium sp. lm-10]MCL7987314.1 homogentisate 1,2-dioxygenase [Sphingobacterium sp. lm-10]
MPHYQRRGQVPDKRHVQFRKADGSLYSEQLFSTEGFSNDSSLLYHHYIPTAVTQVDEPRDLKPKLAPGSNLMKARALNGFHIKPEKDFLESRKTILYNNDLQIALAAPQQSVTSYFYKNADADEVLFVHEGTGKLLTQYGELPFSYGDYLVVPRGTIYQIHFDDDANRLLIVESFSPIRYPDRYISKNGQLLEHSPFCERDIRTPENLVDHDEHGDFILYTKKDSLLYPIHYATHPFDVVGWDGCCYPYAFSIHNFEPITGRIHQPPPVHQTFEAHNFVICSFVPRLYDYHPLSVPTPYNHSNIDSDELLYYVDGDFMSRKHVERGMLTLHPGGIPHGPHPGTVENSLGKTDTKELAIMIDTFRPLLLTVEGQEIADESYSLSWLTNT